MKRHWPISVPVLALVVLIPGAWILANQPAADENPTLSCADSAPAVADDAANASTVALLDVSYIFKHHAPFVERLAELKSEVQEADAAVRARQQEIEEARAQLAVLEVGSAAHTSMTKEIASARAQLTADIEVQKQTFLRKEAGIYLEVYEEIEAACEAYSLPRGIGAIVRFSEEPANRNEPNSVLARMNRPIVWHHGRLDITRAILELMNDNAADATEEQTDEPHDP